MRSWLKERPEALLLSSDLARVEVHRSTQRRDPTALTRSGTVLAGIHLIPMGERVVTAALTNGDTMLRSLDAIHLASAAPLRPRLTSFVVYDKRLHVAAAAEGLPVEAPGQ